MLILAATFVHDSIGRAGRVRRGNKALSSQLNLQPVNQRSSLRANHRELSLWLRVR
jgi:hypothetical protein